MWSPPTLHCICNNKLKCIALKLHNALIWGPHTLHFTACAILNFAYIATYAKLAAQCIGLKSALLSALELELPLLWVEEEGCCIIRSLPLLSQTKNTPCWPSRILCHQQLALHCYVAICSTLLCSGNNTGLSTLYAGNDVARAVQ